MKYLRNLSVRIAIAVVIGLMFASLSTKITYSCAPLGGAESCVSFEKAVTHPNDLLSNKQDSLMHFSETFAVTTLICFIILSVFAATQKKYTAQLKQ